MHWMSTCYNTDNWRQAKGAFHIHDILFSQIWFLSDKTCFVKKKKKLNRPKLNLKTNYGVYNLYSENLKFKYKNVD